MTIKSDVLVESRSLRESVADRIDILDKIKNLSLLPDNINLTVQMGATYYEVGLEAIHSIIKEHRNELEGDGLILLQGAELRKFVMSYKDMANYVSKKTRSLIVFPKRALLRIGMLLKESAVAEALRTKLLDDEKEVSNTSTVISALSPQLQFMIQMEQRTNELESKQAELNQAFTHLSLVVDNEVWITDHQKADIKQAVLSRVGSLKRQAIDAHFQGAFSDLNKFFNVPKYDKIKRADYAQAMEFVNGWFPKRKESTSL